MHTDPRFHSIQPYVRWFYIIGIQSYIDSHMHIYYPIITISRSNLRKGSLTRVDYLHLHKHLFSKRLCAKGPIMNAKKWLKYRWNDVQIKERFVKAKWRETKPHFYKVQSSLNSLYDMYKPISSPPNLGFCLFH